MRTDFGMSAEQRLLAESARRFIGAAWPMTAVRASADDDAPVKGTAGPVAWSQDHDRQAAELGWYAMLVPEEYGGGAVSDNPVRDVCVIAEERGRALQPGGFAAMNAVSAGLARAGAPRQRSCVLPAIASGDGVVSWAYTTAAGPYPTRVDVDVKGDNLVLNGRASWVADGHRCRWLLLSAVGDSGPTQLLVPSSAPGLTVRPLDGLDVSRTFCEVDFDGVEVPHDSLVGTLGGAAEDLERQCQVAIAITLAETVGAMSRAFERAVQYAKTRIAFGRPIGAFQALKHLLADTGLLLETSRALAVSAASAVGQDNPDAAKIVSMAKAYVGDSGIELAQNCLQVFAGIGYTWEHDHHLYLRRLTVDSVLFGDPTWHRERLCRLSHM